MKLTRIRVNDEIHLAKQENGRIHDLGTDRSINEIISAGDIGELKKAEGEYVPYPQYADLLVAGKIICVGFNYVKHSEGMKVAVPEYPMLFSKFSDCIAACGEDIEMIPEENSYDYEGELVAVIGKKGYRIPRDKALEHVFGYTVGNDVSIRDAQFRTSQFLIGKAMKDGAPCGPLIVTADSYSPDNKQVRTWVNGELRQDGNTDEMVFKVEDIISYASRYFELEPGDMIFTGTPSGVARELPEKGYLKKGDIVEIEIEGIGRLVNRMV